MALIQSDNANAWLSWQARADGGIETKPIIHDDTAKAALLKSELGRAGINAKKVECEGSLLPAHQVVISRDEFERFKQENAEHAGNKLLQKLKLDVYLQHGRGR